MKGDGVCDSSFKNSSIWWECLLMTGFIPALMAMLLKRRPTLCMITFLGCFASFSLTGVNLFDTF